VTWRELVNAGIANIVINGQTFSGNGSNLPFAPANAEEVDLTPPPQPQNLQATAAVSNIILSWNDPGIARISLTEVWRSSTNVAPDVNGSTAVLIGTTEAYLFADNVGPGSGTRYYWVRFRTKWDVTGPYSSSANAATQVSVEYLLATLTGAITETQLYSTLGTKISLIDAPNTTAGSVNARVKALKDSTDQSIAAVQSQVNELINIPAYSATTTYAVDNQVTYNGSLYKAKSTTTGNLPTNTTYWTLIGNYTSLGDAVAAHTTQITNLGNNLATEISDRTTLYNQVNNATTGLPATRTTLIDNYYTKTATDTAISGRLTSYVTSTSLATQLGNYTNTSLLQDGYYSKTGTDNAITSRLTNYVSTTALDTTLGSYATTSNLTTNYATKSDLTQAKSDVTTTLTSAYQTADTATLNSAKTYTQGYAYAQSQTYTKSDVDSAISSTSTTLTSAYQAADTTALNSAKSYTEGYAYAKSETYTRAQAESAISSQTNTIAARLNNGGDIYSAIQTEATTRANADGALQAQYTVKVDTNGYVSGFGLASTSTGATPTSDFIVRADRFSIAAPTGPNSGITPSIPFIVNTSATTINGVNVPAGVYIKDGFIQNGTITTAKIGDAAIDTAKIADAAIVEAKIGAASISTAKIKDAAITNAKIDTLDAGKITAGYISAERIAANSITSGKISVTSLSAVSANMGGLNSGYINLSGDGTGDGYIRSYNKWWTDNNNGWVLNRNGTTGDTFIKFTAGNSTFKMSSWQDNVIEWKDTSGNEKLYIDASGNARFSGTLTANAVNAVNTININGDAVTIPRVVGGGFGGISSGAWRYGPYITITNAEVNKPIIVWLRVGSATLPFSGRSNLAFTSRVNAFEPGQGNWEAYNGTTLIYDDADGVFPYSVPYYSENGTPVGANDYDGYRQQHLMMGLYYPQNSTVTFRAFAAADIGGGVLTVIQAKR
jgi:hypothetical protein